MVANGVTGVALVEVSSAPLVQKYDLANEVNNYDTYFMVCISVST